MSKSNSSKMQWPTVADVAADLHHIREMYCEVPGDVPGDNGCRDTQDDDGVWVDVRGRSAWTPIARISPPA
jgi:hypothetical protein